MPSRERFNEFIAVVESGDHADAIERNYTEDASMRNDGVRDKAATASSCAAYGCSLQSLRAQAKQSISGGARAAAASRLVMTSAISVPVAAADPPDRAGA